MTKSNPIFFLITRAWDWIKHGMKYVWITLMPKSLLYRFVLIILLPLLMFQLIMTGFFYNRHWDSVSRRLSADITGEINLIIRQLDTGTKLNPTPIRQELGLEITYLPDKTLPAQSLLSDKVTTLYTNLKERLTVPFVLDENEEKGTALYIQRPGGILKIDIPRKRFFSSTITLFLLWSCVSSALLFAIAFLFMKNQVRAIERLSRASELFGTGMHQIDFKPEGAREVRQAGRSFILMKNRIYKYITERTTMLAGVSHDLRTPLTRMKLQLSLMDDSEEITALKEDIFEMEDMLNAYLAFTKGEDKTPPERINLTEMVADLCDKAKKTGQKIDFHAEESLFVQGRPGDLKRAITNLFTNAARYANQAQVHLGVRQNMATLFVDDNGQGIPQEKLTDVFKAFFRLEKSRNTKTGGIGLGLTITRDIILAHGGDITLSNDSPLGGLRVTVKIPLATK